jgi:hypothetical protein
VALKSATCFQVGLGGCSVLSRCGIAACTTLGYEWAAQFQATALSGVSGV